MAGRGLELRDLARPLAGILPEIRSPSRAIPHRQKVAITAVSVLIFLVGSQLPLYGVRYKSDTDNPLYWTQAASIANSNLGIANGIITLLLSEGLLHPLLRLRILKLDTGVPEDQMLLNRLQKLLGILIAAAFSIAKVLFSTIADKLSTGQTILIVLQLFFGGVIVIYLDELLRKGYGLLSGIPLFTTTKICTSICWKAFSPLMMQLYDGRHGNQYRERAIISSLIHRMIANGDDELSAMHKAFSSRNLPDMASLLATCAFFLLVLTLQGVHVMLPLRSREEPMLEIHYTIRLSYLSFAPLLFHPGLFLCIYFIPQFLYMKFGENKVINLLGRWKESKYFGQAVPVSGLAYYATTPPTLADVGKYPFHTLVYALWVLLGSAVLSVVFFQYCAHSKKYFVRLLGEPGEPRRVMIAQADCVPWSRFRRYIATAAFLVGLCIGALTLLAGFTGVVGSATGIMLAVTVLYSCFQDSRGRQAAAFGF